MNIIAPTFSAQQAQALDTVAHWFKHRSRRKKVFRLFGYAGTGKTTLARHLAERVEGKVCFAAFTGKAALMMAKNGCEGATTIHRLIYKVRELPDGTTRFTLNTESELADAALLVLDECSMVGKDLAADLKSFGVPILVLGDPAQLPPIEGEGYFTARKPDIMLTEVHRQAADSPVLELATRVREGRPLTFGSYGSSRVIEAGELSIDDYLAADQVVVGRNLTRRLLNEDMRTALGHTGDMPVEGDRLVCLRNEHSIGVYNGGLFMVSNVPTKERYSERLTMMIRSEDFPDDGDERIFVEPAFFKGEEDLLSAKRRRESHEFAYGYALTAHKSQGSQWDHVLVRNESGFFGKHASRWLYTAITRAKESVTIVRGA